MSVERRTFQSVICVERPLDERHTIATEHFLTPMNGQVNKFNCMIHFLLMSPEI